MTLLATSSDIWVAVGSVTAGLLLIVPGLALAWLVLRRCIDDPSSYGPAVRDVQRFIELTERSRMETRSAPRLPLLDPEGGAAASAAINRALVVKDAARRALWESSREPLVVSAEPQTERVRRPQRAAGVKTARIALD